MNIELNTENLQNLCRICFSEGEFNIQHFQVELPSSEYDNELISNAKMQLDTTEAAIDVLAEEVSIFEMLRIFHSWRDKLELYDDEPQLVCHTCLNEILKCYLFYRKMETAHRQIEKIYNETYELQDDTNEDILYEEEAHLDDNLDGIELDCEPVVDEELHIDQVIEISPKETTIIKTSAAAEPTSAPEKRHQEEHRRKMSKDPKFVLTGGVTKMLTHISRDTDNGDPAESSHKRLCTAKTSPEKGQKRKRLHKYTTTSSMPLENASLVVSQFIPSIRQETIELDTGVAHSESSETIQLPRDDLRTMDYGPVEIKISDFNEMSEILSSHIEHEDASDSNRKPTVYACKYCPRAFSAAEYLIAHVRKSHVCRCCTMAFAKTSDLYAHIKEMHQRHICVVCNIELSTHSNLRGHIKRMHGIKLPKQVALLDYRPQSSDTMVTVEEDNGVELVVQVERLDDDNGLTENCEQPN